MDDFAEAEAVCLAQSTLLEHGEDAPSLAHRRAADRLRKLDRKGARLWCIVSRRAQQMLSLASGAQH